MSNDSGLSVTQEIALEIARISQTRVVQVERVSFECGEQHLKMVKTTLGYGWLLNNTVLFEFSDAFEAATAFYMNIRYKESPENSKHYVRFGGSAQIVWSFDALMLDHQMKEPLAKLVKLLKKPPVRILPADLHSD